MRILILALCLTVTPFVARTQAQLAAWNVSGTNAVANNPFSATLLSPQVANAALTLGGGVSASTTSNTFGASSFDTTSLGAAIANRDYISFSLTPSPGFNLNIDSLAWNSGVATAVTQFNVALFSSATGFTIDDALHTYSFSTAGAAAQSVTLSTHVSLQDIAGSIEFRLYGWRDTTGTSTFRIRDLAANDLSISGTAISAVPEPSSYAAISGTLMMAGAIWRRRQAKKKP